MTAADGYDLYYADKLWALLPEVYRAQDSDQFGVGGPLRELVNRIGGQAAIVRRDIDRMWDDQSIETCDDWLIPYVGALLDVNLVGGLDARGQRLDVAKTIYYRRRKGTVAILEEIASDITGWDAKVVEFFRRLGRSRHGLDPPIGLATDSPDAAALQQAQGLRGRLTGTGIGGFADLRNVYGARKAHSAFDEYFHTADLRRGRGLAGWYDIPRLGVFLWRLISLPTGPVTTVPVASCPGWFTFDPTGRDVPLFALARPANQFGDAWTSPGEADLPGPISQPLLDRDLAAAPSRLYPAALAVSQYQTPPPSLNLLPAADLILRPERGRFRLDLTPPPGEIVATYAYGVPSLIGAGAYDRRLNTLPIPTPLPAATVSDGATSATSLPDKGTLTFADSFTYAGLVDVAVTDALTLRAGQRQRPLIRLPGGAVTLTGQAGATLTLDGLFLSGGDLVLAGEFESVTLSCCTLDPGSGAPADAAVQPFAISADGRPLVAARVWIEGRVKTLTADRCVLGPIRTRGEGLVETVCLSNSILQALPTTTGAPLTPEAIKDPARFEQRLQQGMDLVSAHLRSLSAGIATLLGDVSTPPFSEPPPPTTELAPLVDLVNALIAGPSIYDPAAFAQTPLSARTSALLESPSPDLALLNRALLDDAFPLELADLALGFSDGDVCLSRCTVMGRIHVHRLEASECILQQLATVADTQHGCVRFSAWTSASVLPRKYESVRIGEGAPLFTSVEFGQPAYGQLTPLADAAILPPATPDGLPAPRISEGAEDGSEMGAYARDKTPIKARAVIIKFEEYMPAGLVPVPINVT